ncbi:helix-turn-helix domain-containing protein [Streptomyces diastaticus]|uniref:helix-turn-helix domain-containing protein n=1 Tax=Streptomyces diastaticus TaxID=1956 RepID=UPI003652598F
MTFRIACTEESVMVESNGTAGAPRGAAVGRHSVASTLNRLFQTEKNPSTGRSFTNAEVARAVGLSESAISQLRSGAKANPTLTTIERLAGHFGVEPAVFFSGREGEGLGEAPAGESVEPRGAEGESEEVRASKELLAAVSDAGVRGLALRANGLSPESLRMIAGVITQARRLEGLDDPQGEG